MTILVTLEINARPENTTAVQELLAELFPDTRAYEGCTDITAYLNDNGYTFIFVENWESKEKYEKYLAWREETGSLAALGGLLQGPPTIRYFEAVDA